MVPWQRAHRMGGREGSRLTTSAISPHLVEFTMLAVVTTRIKGGTKEGDSEGVKAAENNVVRITIFCNVFHSRNQYPRRPRSTPTTTTFFFAQIPSDYTPLHLTLDVVAQWVRLNDSTNNVHPASSIPLTTAPMSSTPGRTYRQILQLKGVY